MRRCTIPEGPELAHSRDVLRNSLLNSSVTDATPTGSGRYSDVHPDGFQRFLSDVKSGGNLTISSVDTKGKFMWWTMKNATKTWYMWSTYGMSGQWMKRPSKHTAFVIESQKDQQAIQTFFNDPRHFGTLKFVDDERLHLKKLNSLGPCIITGGLTPEVFTTRILRKQNRTICEALMDQTAVSGVGNYLRAEILYRARLSPWRPVVDVTASEYVDLCKHTIETADMSYRSNGASISTYRTVDGSKGQTQFDFEVYGRKNCPQGHAISRMNSDDGRMMWWCENCQK